MPTKVRPSSKMLYDDDRTIITRPTMKPIAATKKVIRRPYRSVKHCAKNAPKTDFTNGHGNIASLVVHVHTSRVNSNDDAWQAHTLYTHLTY